MSKNSFIANTKDEEEKEEQEKEEEEFNNLEKKAKG